MLTVSLNKLTLFWLLQVLVFAIEVNTTVIINSECIGKCKIVLFYIIYKYNLLHNYFLF